MLNARNDSDEAKIVSRAGHRGQINVATNMAGRGTDIPLGTGVAKLGGLHVIATSANEASRIDRQLIGRCARQGDPGSYQQIYSMEDEMLTKTLSAKVLDRAKQRVANTPVKAQRLARKLTDQAQKKVEMTHAMTRKNLQQQERQLSRTLAFSGRAE